MFTFDIETAALNIDRLKEICPPFDESEVKLGNTKDKDKIAAKIEAARAKHEADFIEKAALSATTGRVLCIGVWCCEKQQPRIISADDPADEMELLRKWWGFCDKQLAAARAMAGINIFQFDLPFLVRRSWILGVDIPATTYQRLGRKFIWHSAFIDLAEEFLLGQKWGGETSASFDSIARAFGTEGKPEGVSGADFSRLWLSGDVEERKLAEKYLVNDVKQPSRWAEMMGVVA